MADAETEKEVITSTCQLFISRKHRYCKALPVTGKSYCVEHSHLEQTNTGSRKRIACPLDPKHSVFEDRLEKHLKKCNSRVKDLPAYQVMNFNSGMNETSADDDQEVEFKAVCSEELLNLTERIKSIHKGVTMPFEDYRGKCHPAVSAELECEATKRSRHLVQVGALLALLQDRDQLRENTAFIEFGAGRGQLAHWVQRSLPPGAHCTFVLVDRANPRHKFDWRHKWGEGPLFHRLRLDIEHLDLSKVDVIPSDHCIVCVSKHLCGDATDLTLRCISNYADTVRKSKANEIKKTSASAGISDGCPSEKRVCLEPGSCQALSGVLVALCCHHRCSWRHYCGREAFLELGLTARDFRLMTRMSTWATCGTRATVGTDVTQTEDSDHSAFFSHPRFGTLSVVEREEIGRMCKRLIDFGRVKFLEKRFPHVALCYYVDHKESLENVAIFGYH